MKLIKRPRVHFVRCNKSPYSYKSSWQAGRLARHTRNIISMFLIYGQPRGTLKRRSKHRHILATYVCYVAKSDREWSRQQCTAQQKKNSWETWELLSKCDSRVVMFLFNMTFAVNFVVSRPNIVRMQNWVIWISYLLKVSKQCTIERYIYCNIVIVIVMSELFDLSYDCCVI